MSRKDRISAEINLLKTWITLAVTAFFAVAGWAFTHYGSASDMQLIVAGLAILVIVAGILALNRAVGRFLQELEELE